MGRYSILTDSEYKGPTDSKSSGSGSTLVKDWYTGKIPRDPAGAPWGRQDRELLLAMSKAIVAIAQEQEAPGFGLKYASELAAEQLKYREQFFPETIEP